MPKGNSKDLITFKPKEVGKKLLGLLPERARDILTKRYGLGKNAEHLTLEAIGGEYGITRERVRQIENFALNGIKKSADFSKFEAIFNELKEVMNDFGGVVHEVEFLNALAKDKSSQNHIHFLLVISDAFTKLKEDEDFHHRWTTDKNFATRIHKSLTNLCTNLSEKDLISETQLLDSFLVELKEIADTARGREKEMARRWITLSKSLNQNPLGEWGLAKSPNVRMRGIRDYAFLVLRQHGSPMHFNEVAKGIEKLFGKVAHPATCHNELIKDKRFVLVGRGLYALAEWGYNPGVVADVIRSILKKESPLTKDEIIARVMKERYVKENTILVNLQNPKLFKKDSQSRYSIA